MDLNPYMWGKGVEDEIDAVDVDEIDQSDFSALSNIPDGLNEHELLEQNWGLLNIDGGSS